MDRDERSRSRGLEGSDAAPVKEKQPKAKVSADAGLDNIDSPDLIGAEPISPPRPKEQVNILV